MAPLSEALNEAPGSLGTVRNAVLLLELLAEGPAYQQLTDLADRSGLSVPTVHRLLRSLVLAALVEQDPQTSRYGLGPQLTRLSHRYLARVPVLAALAPYLAPLRDAVDETVSISLLVGTSVVEVDRVDGSSATPFRHPYAVRPALRTAAGRLLAARADDERWKLALEDVDEPIRALAEQERSRWAQAPWLVVAGEAPGVPAEAAVTVGEDGAAPAALTVQLAGEADAERLEEVTGQLARVAEAAVRALGHG